jgi:hypothetical protein
MLISRMTELVREFSPASGELADNGHNQITALLPALLTNLILWTVNAVALRVDGPLTCRP